jgi:hypothetical protein
MNRRWRLTLGIVGAVALATGLAVVDRYPVGVFHDDAMYVILARSLATGQGFRYLNIPGAPNASHFPPGYPALLSLAWRMAPAFPANVVVFKMLNAVFFAACAVLITQLVRERLGSTRLAVATGVLTAIGVPLLVLVTMVLSEPLFLALLLGLLLASERYVSSHPSWQRAIALGACAGLLTLVRAHGIVMVPALVIPLAMRRRWREVALVAGAAVAVLLPWQIWGATHAEQLPAPLAGNYGSYIGWWLRGYRDMGPAMIPETIRRTVAEVLGMLATLFSPLRASAGRAVTLVALVVAFAIGLSAMRRRAPVTLCFLACYAAIVLLWPFPPSRFVWGVWPLLLFVLVASVSTLANTSRTALRPRQLAFVATLLWLAVGYGEYEGRAVRGTWWSSISRASSARIEPEVAWTLANTSSGDVIAADDEGAVFLYTGRQAVPVASFTTAHYLTDRSAQVEAQEGLVPLLAAYPVRAVLVGSQKTFDAAQLLAARPRPPLAFREQFDGGAAFTVLHR